MTIKRIISVIILLLTIFLVYRLVRPLQIFIISPEFELPIDLGKTPEGIESISAASCGKCHEEIYKEWQTSMHSKAWKDPYFKVDFEYDGRLQVCLNCHTPLKDQQKHLVTGFSDSSKFRPILEDNPDFNPDLRNEGVTCAVCHVRDGFILGPRENIDAPHVVRQDNKLSDGHSICSRCHMVMGNSWDTFYRYPPCGTFAEALEAGGKPECAKCHMPDKRHSLTSDSELKIHRQHIWRGGHDPEMVKKGLTIEVKSRVKSEGKVILSLTNSGANHSIPTGTPDRHLRVTFRLINKKGELIREKSHKLQRTILWRPFIIDLWDTRIKSGERREYSFFVRNNGRAAFLEIEVRYHLLDEKRRRKIGYENKDPVDYRVFYERIDLID